MLSIKVNEYVRIILKLFDDAHYLMDSIELIDSVSPKWNDMILVHVEESHGEKAFTENFVELSNIVAKIQAIELIVSVHKLDSDLGEFSEIQHEVPIRLIQKQLKIFNETYLRSYKYQANFSFELFEITRSLKLSIAKFKDNLQFYLDITSYSCPLEENQQKLSIMLSSSFTLSEFIVKLQAIEVMYNELCMLTDVSLTDHPLQIMKIESGSLLAELFGETRVIKLLTHIFESCVNYISKKNLVEMRGSTINERAADIQKVIDLRQQMANIDIDVKDIDKNIEKSVVILAKRMVKILEYEDRIDINDKTIQLRSTERSLDKIKKIDHDAIGNKIKEIEQGDSDNK